MLSDSVLLRKKNLVPKVKLVFKLNYSLKIVSELGIFKKDSTQRLVAGIGATTFGESAVLI